MQYSYIQYVNLKIITHIRIFSYTDERYNSEHSYNEWFIPYNDFNGWFFKVNISDL
jgi:hypothetical protein